MAAYQASFRAQGTWARIAGASISRALLTSFALHLFVLCALLVNEPTRRLVVNPTNERFESVAIEATLIEEKAMSNLVVDSASRPDVKRREAQSEADAMSVQVQADGGTEKVAPKSPQLVVRPEASDPDSRREVATAKAEKAERTISTGSDRTVANWKSRIAAAIEGEWVAPPSAGEAIVCTLQITQSRTGDVLDAQVLNCNGDDGVRQSISTAAYRASPLPTPPAPSQFEATLVITFRIE